MTLEEIKKRIAHIEKIAADDEAAHGEEDDLRHDVLKAIAGGSCEDPAACAALVLTTSEIDFCRWCA